LFLLLKYALGLSSRSTVFLTIAMA
jgi:hypothetical protein